MSFTEAPFKLNNEKEEERICWQNQDIKKETKINQEENKKRA